MNFQALFPILKHSTYLNTAYSGILSEPILDWRRAHDQSFMDGASDFRIEQPAFLQEVRIALSRYFNAEVAHTFLVPNFSHGFARLLEGIPASHRFLLIKEDYPAVNYSVVNRGFAVDYVLPDADLEGNILAQMAATRPDVFAFSIVQYSNGLKIDLQFLKRLKQLYPDLLIVADGTQYCGTESFDFDASGVDVLIASGYKWMLGGYGNGFMLMKPSVSADIYSANQELGLPNEAFLQDRTVLSLYFESGHQDSLSFGTLYQSILWFEDLGKDFIDHRINNLIVKAKSAFEDRGLLAPEIVNRKLHSNIFNLLIAEEDFTKLERTNIKYTARGRGIRVSFHFYNTEQDLQHLLDVLDGI
ncbi:aminotransferase class V-fold PLP-dependent enzyme [Pedobacter duraquae]|uniref:Selenocysteine lyase/cysteine desulfurase n=1 Tax=Pedobacter duraquae TaxID=425511 RepID=A0A4R6IL88_9SPHI|nr:aminotransferase class V-fold PLP-dependent enzyme [Pedobacter duraquae]TDO22884.1 selenocysteine lyase/cysteine desulfurase [Pedobacter duraquae]